MLIDIISEYHKATNRDYLGRMNALKPHCMNVARLFEYDFWDGDRKYGYGGYKYDGRWKPIAEKLIERYGLTKKSSVLDIGCGKAHLLYEIKQLIGCEVVGCEISLHAIKEAKVPVQYGNASTDMRRIFGRKYDLVLSINTLHNLTLPRLKQAIHNINRISKQAYIVVESYRNAKELCNLQCWALTAEQFLRPQEWEFLFKEWGYKSDYEFIYFE